jgi:hypothetical protein
VVDFLRGISLKADEFEIIQMFQKNIPPFTLKIKSVLDAFDKIEKRPRRFLRFQQKLNC